MGNNIDGYSRDVRFVFSPNIFSPSASKASLTLLINICIHESLWLVAMLVRQWEKDQLMIGHY